MTHSTDLLQHLFGKADLTEISTGQLDEMEKEYPYFAHAHWLAAIKKRDTEGGQQALYRAGAYALHPLRLKQYLPPKEQVKRASAAIPAPAPAKEQATEQALSPAADAPAADRKQTTDKPVGQAPPVRPQPASSSSDTPANGAAGEAKELAGGQDTPVAPIIQPLFTQDYFAYTGMKLPDHVENDKPPTMEQLHSFTDWLRAMKRPRGTTDPDVGQDTGSLAAQDETEDAGIRKSADESVRAEAEVLTEAMAEVRAGKGQIPRAIAIYEKLSLSNPEKSAYFAQKIEALKNK
jgi:hypothetical protein